jgi:transcriptional regulator GlxA family with amidase domain
LQRLFNDHIGEPMMQFYRRVRLAKANELLQQSASSIIQIALATGFSSPAYFSRAFQWQYGLTPSDRRKQSRTNPTTLESQKPRGKRIKRGRPRY